MTSHTWVGGGNNNASNPDDWSPTGVPEPGDTLKMADNTTMNIQGAGLVGNALTLGANDTVNLSGYAAADIASRGGSGTVNIGGMDIANITSVGTVNLEDHAVWIGSFDAIMEHSFLLQGNGVFINQSSAADKIMLAKVDVPVVGSGSFSVGAMGTLEFGKSVSAGQHVDVNIYGELQIDDPTDFHGTVNLGGSLSSIDLEGLANADSYSFRNDMLSFYSGNKVIDTLHLHYTGTDQSGSDPLAVAKTATGFFIHGNPDSSGASSNAFPVHAST